MHNEKASSMQDQQAGIIISNARQLALQAVISARTELGVSSTEALLDAAGKIEAWLTKDLITALPGTAPMSGIPERLVPRGASN
jgi:hypothetical protein